MAKENRLQPAALFAISTVLLVAGFLMKLFPLFIFVGLAPLIAITDHVRNEQRFWNLAELIGVALFVGFLAAHLFDMSFLVMSLIPSIAMTFAFMGYTFVHQRLGFGLGKLIIVIFWLGIEYLLALLPIRENVVYLGDALALKTSWLNWTAYTGYTGITLWILLVNVLLYFALFREKKINRLFLVLGLLTITGPVIFAYLAEGRPISRMDMLATYGGKISVQKENYIHRGEVIHKAAAGLSVILLLGALIKNKKNT